MKETSEAVSEMHVSAIKTHLRTLKDQIWIAYHFGSRQLVAEALRLTVIATKSLNTGIQVNEQPQ